MFRIPVPVHPTEVDLPRSTLRLQLEGQVAELHGVPLQGVKTIESILATLEIWKPTIIKDDPSPFRPLP